MNIDGAAIPPEFLASIQPVVLVGGKSTRFGRDKLREPFGDSGELLIQRPINALRAVFGPRVCLVGDCHPNIVPLADGVITDEYPGVGPMGGILSALRARNAPVFVLAGDMPLVTPECVATIVRTAAHLDATESGAVSALWAQGERDQPCCAVYFPSAITHLLQQAGAGRYALRTALPPSLVRVVAVPSRCLHNINAPSDLGGARGSVNDDRPRTATQS